MAGDRADWLALADRAIAGSIAAHQQARGQLATTVSAAGVMLEALRAGGKILVFGNGGSASDAQHFAAELVGRFMRERDAMAALALTTDTSILTAVANDYSFRQVFVRQMEALGRPGDVAFGITTSGESLNVVDALRAAGARGLKTIALTGSGGGAAGAAADVHVNVPDRNPARVQEVHRTLLHVMCELIEAGS